MGAVQPLFFQSAFDLRLGITACEKHFLSSLEELTVTRNVFSAFCIAWIAWLLQYVMPNGSAEDRIVQLPIVLLVGGGLVALLGRRYARGMGRIIAVCLGAGLLTVSASAQISDTTAPVLVDFSFAPDAVTAIGGPGVVTVTARVTDDLSGTNGVTAIFFSPSFQNQGVGMPRISGDQFDGVYQGQLSIPEFSESGVWRAQVVVGDAVGNFDSHDSTVLAGLGFPTDLTVTSVQDVTPPAITAVTYTPTAVDVSAGPQTINIALQIVDDLSGVDLTNPNFLNFLFNVSSPSGIQTQRISTLQFSLTAGTALNGTWEASLTLPQFSEPGAWHVDNINLQDNVRNFTSITGLDLQALGIPTTFDVVSTPADTTPPSLIDLTFTPAFINTSTASQNVVLTFRLADDLSGVSFLPDAPNISLLRGAYFESPSGSQFRFPNNFTLTNGTPLDGTWEGTFFFPQFSEDGDWRIAFFHIEDAVRNGLSLTTAELDARGVPRLVIVRPSLDSDGIVDPTAGGVIQDDSFGNRAQISVPPGLFTASTDVAIDVFEEPLNIPNPTGFSAPGTLFVNIELTPQPTFPLSAPGLTIVLPVENPLPPGSPLSLFKVDTASGLLVPAIGVSGLPVTGTVDPSGLSATFTGIASLSTVVGLVPLDQTPRQKIEALITSVNSLVTAGKLKSAQGRVLTGTLAIAIRNLDQGKTKLAVLLVKGFIVEVKLLVRLKRLANADGQPLIDAAEAIVAELK